MQSVSTMSLSAHNLKLLLVGAIVAANAFNAFCAYLTDVFSFSFFTAAFLSSLYNFRYSSLISA